MWNKVRGEDEVVRMLGAVDVMGQPDARGYDDNAGYHVIPMSQHSTSTNKLLAQIRRDDMLSISLQVMLRRLWQ